MALTLAQKIIQNHTDEKINQTGQIVQVHVDWLFCHDVNAPLAIDAFKAMGCERVFDKDKVALICDHFTPCKDIASAEQVKISRDFSREMDLTHFFEGTNSGVEHVLFPELGLVGPGDMVVGADSHSVTHGGLGAFSTGMGSTDIAAIMALGRTWLKVPETKKVVFTGKLPPFIGGKDLILYLIGQIGVAGATYQALEFSGDAADELSVEQRMTVSNMTVEAGAKAGLFAADAKTISYCAPRGHTGRELYPDDGAEYADEITIDVEKLSPQVAKPHIPENVAPVEELTDVPIDQVFIGSCTNGRISDLRDAANIIKGHKVAKNVRLIVIPTTPTVYDMALREGLLSVFRQAGAIIGPPTCGPCCGGHMGILATGERCLSTTNRNFKGRMGSYGSEIYLASPAVAAATAVVGTISHPKDVA